MQTLGVALHRGKFDTELDDARVTAHVRRLLVPPSPVMRGWDYGTEDEAYPCWSVLEHNASNTGIAYCESGFGPSFPWGLVFFTGTENMSIGMDSGWFQCFLEAYLDARQLLSCLSGGCSKVAMATLLVNRFHLKERGNRHGAKLSDCANSTPTYATTATRAYTGQARGLTLGTRSQPLPVVRDSLLWQLSR